MHVEKHDPRRASATQPICLHRILSTAIVGHDSNRARSVDAIDVLAKSQMNVCNSPQIHINLLLDVLLYHSRAAALAIRKWLALRLRVLHTHADTSRCFRSFRPLTQWLAANSDIIVLPKQVSGQVLHRSAENMSKNPNNGKEIMPIQLIADTDGMDGKLSVFCGPACAFSRRDLRRQPP